MEPIRCWVYRTREADSSRDGISRHADTVLLVDPHDQRFKYLIHLDGEPLVFLVSRKIGEGNYLHVEPNKILRNGKCSGWMAGGAFIFTHDSRFPSKYPLSLHDRQELYQPSGAAVDDYIVDCDNDECGWSGKKTDTTPRAHPGVVYLCPRCGEATEPHEF